MQNIEVREKAKRNGVPFWMIASELGIGANTFSVWLRSELSEDQRKRVEAAIDVIIARRKE